MASNSITPKAPSSASVPELTPTPRQSQFPVEGGCDCRYIRYRMITRPLVVHCCHCRWCQRESGSAFATNAMIEANRVVHLGEAQPVLIEIPSESGQGQTVARCPRCNIVMWTNYDGPLLRFVKVGTLDSPGLCPPDVHIFTMSKQPWVVLPEGVKALEHTYENREEIWSIESMQRWGVFMERIRLWEKKKAKEVEQQETLQQESTTSAKKQQRTDEPGLDTSAEVKNDDAKAKAAAKPKNEEASEEEATQNLASLHT